MRTRRSRSSTPTARPICTTRRNGRVRPARRPRVRQRRGRGVRGELEDLERAAADPTATPGLLDAMSIDRSSWGCRTLAGGVAVDEQRQTRPEDVARHAGEAQRSLILLGFMSRTAGGPTSLSADVGRAGRGARGKPLLSLFGIGRRQRLRIGPRASRSCPWTAPSRPSDTATWSILERRPTRDRVVGPRRGPHLPPRDLHATSGATGRAEIGRCRGRKDRDRGEAGEYAERSTR